MPSTLTHPFPLRLTTEERSALDRAFEAFNTRPSRGLSGRTTRTDLARMALDRGLQMLLQDLGDRGRADQASTNQLPHDEAWMTGGLQASSELVPPFDWGDVDPAQDGDPILVVAGRGAFVVK